MTMEGVGKGYTPEQSSVLAVQAGADILLKPTDPTRAINAVVAAVEGGEIPRARIDSAARHILELKARLGLDRNRYVDIEALRDIVGSPAHRALAADVAQRAVTLLRDRDGLVPMRTGRALVIQYAPETELKAGRVFGPTLTAALPLSRVVKVTPSIARSQLDSIASLAQGMDRIIVAAYVRRIEGEGRFAVPQHVAAWIDSLAKSQAGQKLEVVAFGNPYLIRQFPDVGTYLVTYGVSDDLERAAARALLGTARITGRAPISLPGFFRLGDGLTR
jgi:beta-N-acetylhexosaminidase